MKSNHISVSDDYFSAWNFIKEHNNSLKRYSNLDICFTDDKRKL